MSPQAKLLDSQARTTNWFNGSATSLTETTRDGAPFSLTVRQDLVNAIVTTLVPKEELVILLRFVVSPAHCAGRMAHPHAICPLRET